MARQACGDKRRTQQKRERRGTHEDEGNEIEIELDDGVSRNVVAEDFIEMLKEIDEAAEEDEHREAPQPHRDQLSDEVAIENAHKNYRRTALTIITPLSVPPTRLGIHIAQVGFSQPFKAMAFMPIVPR